MEDEDGVAWVEPAHFTSEEERDKLADRQHDGTSSSHPPIHPTARSNSLFFLYPPTYP